MYQDLRSKVTYKAEELFNRSEEEMLHLPYTSQVAWLERVKFLYPIDYKELEKTSVTEARQALDTATRLQKWMGTANPDVHG